MNHKNETTATQIPTAMSLAWLWFQTTPTTTQTTQTTVVNNEPESRRTKWQLMWTKCCFQ